MTQRLLFLTRQDTPAAVRLLESLARSFPTTTIDVLFERREVDFNGRIEAQLKHLRHHGPAWIPYRFFVAMASRLASGPESDEAGLRDVDANEAKWSLVEVDDLHSEGTLQLVREGAYDLGIVYGTGILRKKLFQLPRAGMINIHQGLIPFYRGMPPAFWELYNREEKTGVSIHRVASKLDAGVLLSQRELGISEEDTLESLQEKLDLSSAELLPEAVHVALTDPEHGVHVDLSQGKLYRRPTVKQIWELSRRGKCRFLA